MRKFIIAALCAAIAFPAQAETLKANQPVCITEDLLSQLNRAMFDRDMPAMEYLVQNGCSLSSSPLHATVLGVSSWGMMVHLRAYRGRHAVEVWAFRDAVAAD